MITKQLTVDLTQNRLPNFRRAFGSIQTAATIRLLTMLSKFTWMRSAILMDAPYAIPLQSAIL